MFQFPRFPSPRLCVQRGDDAGDLRPGAGFPHSDIPGSQPAHGSPRLIAVFHVLHRHLAPRHPPYALSSLTQRDAEKSAFFRITIRLLRCASIFASRPAARPPGAGAHLCALAPDGPTCLTQSGPAHRRARNSPLRLCLALLFSSASIVRCQTRSVSCRAQVEMTGLEPVTSALQRQRSPS